ncbi:MAG: hypothetical protein ABH807_02450 [Candidatus Shapirobacteria bacterium]
MNQVEIFQKAAETGVLPGDPRFAETYEAGAVPEVRLGQRIKTELAELRSMFDETPVWQKRTAAAMITGGVGITLVLGALLLSPVEQPPSIPVLIPSPTVMAAPTALSTREATRTRVPLATHEASPTPLSPPFFSATATPTETPTQAPTAMPDKFAGYSGRVLIKVVVGDQTVDFWAATGADGKQVVLDDDGKAFSWHDLGSSENQGKVGTGDIVVVDNVDGQDVLGVVK